MKPFDLEKALAGEPVKLCNGHKAYVLHQFKHKAVGLKSLLGYKTYKTDEGKLVEVSMEWYPDGSTDFPTSNTIIGMWEEPPEIIKIGNFEFPKPVLKPLNKGVKYFVAAPTIHDFYYEMEWENSSYDNDRLKAGHVHLTKEAAVKHAKVLIAISQGKAGL